MDARALQYHELEPGGVFVCSPAPRPHQVAQTKATSTPAQTGTMGDDPPFPGTEVIAHRSDGRVDCVFLDNGKCM